MTQTRALALLAQAAFRSAFREGDEISFAKQNGSYKVVQLSDRGMRVTSPRRTEGYLLDFEKLGVVVKEFGSIPANSTEAGVREVLKKHDLVETSTETILYAAAKEFLTRAGLPRRSSISYDDAAITSAMNRVADEVETRPDEFAAEAARRTLRDSEW